MTEFKRAIYQNIDTHLAKNAEPANMLVDLSCAMGKVFFEMGPGVMTVNEAMTLIVGGIQEGSASAKLDRQK